MGQHKRTATIKTERGENINRTDGGEGGNIKRTTARQRGGQHENSRERERERERGGGGEQHKRTA